jgi:hypothetical protein
MPTLRRPSRLIGDAFAGIIRLLQCIRPARPVHPAGLSLTGSLARHGAGPGANERAGVAWLDEPGESRVEARLSRGLGLPAWLPDIVGLALRVPACEVAPQDASEARTAARAQPASDILLASTGWSRPGRFLVLLRRRVDQATLGTLMPYRTPSGPVLLAARPIPAATRLPASIDGFRRALNGGTWRLGLYWARASGPWVRFGTLDLRLDPGRMDSGVRHDPVLNPPPGLLTYEWTRNLRERSYRLARRRRIDDRRR